MPRKEQDRITRREPTQTRTLFWRGRRGDQTWWAVRDGSLKYIRQSRGPKSTEYLFDLAADPPEK